MTIELKRLLGIRKPDEVEEVIQSLLKKGYRFRPVGDMPNNAGPIELAAEPVSPLVERITNMFDAVLELNAVVKGSGQTLPVSPREASARWCGIKAGHVYHLTEKERQQIGRMVEVIMDDSGRGKNKSPTFIFRDYGIGLHPSTWPTTILSLNKSNKLDKLYLAGAYGQGGSSTFAWCPYSIIVSRRDPRCLGELNDCVGWTIVRVNEGDDTVKNAVYEYLVDPDGNIPTSMEKSLFKPGTYVAHIAYQAGPLVSKAMTLHGYRVFNNLLFDPILPYWLRDVRYNQNRAMGGHISRLLPSNALVEYANEYIKNLDADSKLIVRYWVMKVKPDSQKNPYLAGFLETTRSPDTILITLNGQKQGTLSKSFLKQPDIQLSFLSNYLLVQVECDGLNRRMKRSLFASTREKTKSGEALDQIKAALREILTEDDELARLEAQRKEYQTSQMDEQDRIKVHRLLDRYITKHLQSTQEVAATQEGQLVSVSKTKLGQVTGQGGTPSGDKTDHGSGRKRVPGPPPPPIPPHDPPTYLKCTSPDPLKVYPGGTAWIRLECDAPDGFLSRPINPGSLSVSFTGLDDAREAGRTGLTGGRMRVKVALPDTVEVGTFGHVTFKLEGSGFQPLLATCAILVVEKPAPESQSDSTSKPTPAHVVPPYRVERVSKNDQMWNVLEWDELTVGEYKSSHNELIFYINISNHEFEREQARKKSEEMRTSFANKYTAVIAYHLWLHYQADQSGSTLDDEARQAELRRTASTVMLAMRSETELFEEEE